MKDEPVWAYNMRTACNILVGKPERERPLGSHRRRWKIILKWIL
jgi:hypothetical protein